MCVFRVETGGRIVVSNISFLIVAVVAVTNCVVISGQVSPCPSIFKYELDGNEVIGTVYIKSPGFGVHRLRMALSLKAQLPSCQSPCPDIFKYETYGGNYVGAMYLSNGVIGINKVDLKMTIRSKLPTSYVGRIELLREKELLPVLLRGGSLQYRVHFPLSRPLPKVTSIVFNGNVVCTGPPESFSGPGQYITKIELDHTLRAELKETSLSAPNNPPENNENFYETNQPQSVYDNFPNEPSDNFEIINVNDNSDDNYAANTTPPPKRPPNRVTTRRSRPRPQQPIYQPVPTRRPVQQPIYEPEPPAPQPIQDTIRCGVPRLDNQNSLVVNGYETNHGDWPWIVAMYVKNEASLGYTCTGTLISRNLVVSAAHCTYKSNRKEQQKPSDIVVKVGIHNIHVWDEDTLNINIRGVTQFEYPPGFNYTAPTAVDVVVLFLRSPVTYDNYVVPICLWQGNPDLQNVIGQIGSVVGWGKDERGLQATPEPRLVTVPIVSNDQCRNSKQDFALLVKDYHFCAGRKDGSGPCNGDSGAGMYIWRGDHYELRGIVSFSLLDRASYMCDLSEYVVYVDAAKFAQWMRSILRK